MFLAVEESFFSDVNLPTITFINEFFLVLIKQIIRNIPYVATRLSASI